MAESMEVRTCAALPIASNESLSYHAAANAKWRETGKEAYLERKLFADSLYCVKRAATSSTPVLLAAAAASSFRTASCE